MIDTVTVDALTAELIAHRNWLRENFPHDGSIEELSYDVRLQVHPDGTWTLNTGDSSYDQDHRGFWSSSSIACSDDDERCREIARSLIGDTWEHCAMDDNGNEELETAFRVTLEGWNVFDLENEGDGRIVFGPLPPPLAKFAWPGGYPIVHYVESDAFCPACAERIRDFGALDVSFDRVHSDIYYEGPPLACDGWCDGPRILSAYGDPECIVCNGEVSGLTNENKLWECPECSNPEAPWLSWMRENSARA